jgi:hypothetical protein
MTESHLLAHYETALRKGLAWILRHRNPDGSFGDTSQRKTRFFKVPMALFDNGYNAEAWRTMRWLEAETFTDEGDFEDPRPGYHAAHWPYRNLWFIRAAHFLEMYHLSYGGMGYVLRFRDPATGGIQAVAPYDEQGSDPRQALVLTAFGGLNLVTLGHRAEAEAAGEWVCRLIEAQPALDERLYLMWRPEGGVVAEVPRGHDPLWYAIDRRLLKQDYYNLGVALTFLSHLYRLTGNERFLSGALAYYGFLASCREDRLRSLSSGKVLYGLTWLYLATRDRQYLEEARVAADHLAGSQADDGYWCQHGGPYLNITAEYAFELRWFIQVQKMLF